MTAATIEDMAHLSGQEARLAIRSGRWRHPTAGVATGYVQANLVALPEQFAADFEQFCARNPRPCPLLEITQPGSAEPTRTARGADLRIDLPRYRVYEHGILAQEVEHLGGIWRSDFAAFLLSCSFTFERALAA